VVRGSTLQYHTGLVSYRIGSRSGVLQPWPPATTAADMLSDALDKLTTASQRARRAHLSQVGYSCAILEAEERGLADVLSSEFPWLVLAALAVGGWIERQAGAPADPREPVRVGRGG
jgi:hypothetical protein